MASIKDLQEHLQLVAHNPEADLSRELSGCYIGDLLSWVMAHAFSGCVWITIMSNINVAAVASLTDAACVIMAEGVAPDQDLLDRVKRDDIALFTSPLSVYDIAIKVQDVLNA